MKPSLTKSWYALGPTASRTLWGDFKFGLLRIQISDTTLPSRLSDPAVTGIPVKRGNYKMEVGCCSHNISLIQYFTEKERKLENNYAIVCVCTYICTCSVCSWSMFSTNPNHVMCTCSIPSCNTTSELPYSESMSKYEALYNRTLRVVEMVP